MLRHFEFLLTYVSVLSTHMTPLYATRIFFNGREKLRKTLTAAA